MLAEMLKRVYNFFMKDQTLQMISAPTQPVFDKKYKFIYKFTYSEYKLEMIDWINANSNGSADLIFDGPSKIFYVGFEKSDDALFFKIKYST